MPKIKDLADNVIDDLYIQILRHLLDARKSYSEIAKNLGVATNTVRARINKLIEHGLLEIVGLVDPSVLPGHYTAYIGIKTIPDQARRIAREVGQLKGVISASCVTGGFDLMAFVLFNEGYTMSKFLFDELPKIKGINEVEQFSIYESFNHRCRYVL